MAFIHNSDLTKELVAGAKIQQMSDSVPNQLAEKVVPVMEVNPKLLGNIKTAVTIASLSNATSATIYTTSANVDTYLWGYVISMVKDATATATNINLNVIDAEYNVSQSICNIRGFTLTAKSTEVALMFPKPMKLKRNSNITLTSDTNVANILCSGKLYIVEDLTSNA